MRRALYALLAILGSLAFVAPAVAAPSTADALVIADAWAQRTVPSLPNQCSNGRLQITWDSAAVEAVSTLYDGFADGWTWNGSTYEWDNARCTTTIRAELQGTEQGCRIIVHELLHYVIGPQHEGPLDPRHPVPPACASPLAAAPAAARTVLARRSRAQIARSMRYRRTMARIAARPSG